jgi:hypothetical protein
LHKSERKFKDTVSTGLLSSVADLHHFDADSDPACHYDADSDHACQFTLMRIRIRILASKERLKTLKKCSNRLYSVHFGLSSATWCGSGSSYHFDAGRIKLITLMRIRIQIPSLPVNLMRIRIHNTAP